MACAFVGMLLLASAPVTLGQGPFAGKIGVEVGERPTGFADAFLHQGRLFYTTDASATAPHDSDGWPTTDGLSVIFDQRAYRAWAPPPDDPDAVQPDCSGTYLMFFIGQADLAPGPDSPYITFSNKTYNATWNYTSVDVTLPPGQPSLMEILFTNTQRTPGMLHSGITALHVIRPGMSSIFASSPAAFDPAFLNALAPFSYLRFMNWTGTNYSAGYYGDPGHHLINWADRSLPTDAFQGMGTAVRAGATGVSWEYVIALANRLNKDIWINIPVGATGSSPTDTTSYIYQLALLIKNGNAVTSYKGLNPGLHIYIEHSNEVWNSGFSQYTWNRLAAVDEVSQGGSPLNNDGDTVQLDWAYRRHAKRLYEIAKIFEAVFGPGSLNTTIRPVYAWWTLQLGPNSTGAKTLAWMQATYGPPSNYFHAVAQGAYFTDTAPASTATIPDVLNNMLASSNATATRVVQNKGTANLYGLKLFAYEGGPDNHGTTNMGIQIEANRDPGMGPLVEHHITDNWFAQGGDMFGYFSLAGYYSRNGSYGSTEDYRILSTPKYQALMDLLGN
jgi:hypothetical protein